MEIYLLNTAHGLIPCYDDDYDQRKKLRIGVTYKAKITVPRNLDFHRKYFSLLKCAWALMTQAQREFFHEDEECFRATVQIAAGFSKKYYSITHKEWREESLSISFSSMGNDVFQEVYSKVFDIILQYFLKHITEDDFRNNLSNFM